MLRLRAQYLNTATTKLLAIQPRKDPKSLQSRPRLSRRISNINSLIVYFSTPSHQKSLIRPKMEARFKATTHLRDQFGTGPRFHVLAVPIDFIYQDINDIGQGKFSLFDEHDCFHKPAILCCRASIPRHKLHHPVTWNYCNSNKETYRSVICEILMSEHIAFSKSPHQIHHR